MGTTTHMEASVTTAIAREPHTAPVVLVVDDEPSIQRVLGRLLNLSRCEVRHAARQDEVISIATAEHIDAFMIDLTLGSESGIDVLTWVRQQPRYHGTPVLVFTGLAFLPIADEATIRAHRAEVFYKTDTLRLAVESVKQLLGMHLTQ